MLSADLVSSLAFPAAIAGLVIGALFALFSDRYVLCLRRWLLTQLRMVRKPAYLRFHRVMGYVLLGLSLLLLILLAIGR